MKRHPSLPLVVAVITLFSSNLGAQTSSQNKENRQAINQLIGQKDLAGALTQLNKAVESFSGSDEELVLLQTLRAKIASHKVIEREYDSAIKELKATTQFMSDHIEDPVAQGCCVFAFRGLANLVRIGHSEARSDELAITIIEDLLKLEKGSSVTAVSRRAGELAALWAHASGGEQKHRDRLLETITKRIEQLNSHDDNTRDEDYVLALSSFYAAHSLFYFEDVEKFKELSLELEQFLCKNVAENPDSFELSGDLSNATVRRISRILSTYPDDARTSAQNAREALDLAKKKLGSRVLHQIEAVKRMERRLPKQTPRNS